MNSDIKVKIVQQGFYKNPNIIHKFNWNLNNFIIKSMYMNHVCELLGCKDIAYNIRKIMKLFTINHYQLGHILMVALQLMNFSDGWTLPSITINYDHKFYTTKTVENIHNVDFASLTACSYSRIKSVIFVRINQRLL